MGVAGTQTEQPIERFLALLKGYKRYGRGYTAHCPGGMHSNGDSHPSLMIWENPDGHVGVKCHAGCNHKEICEALGISVSDLYVPDGRTYRPRLKPRKLDILDLAIDKCIPPALLFNLGLQESYTWEDSKGKPHRNVVRIPYHTIDGKEHTRARIRTALQAKMGSYWEGPDTDPIIPYGLNKLEQARKTGHLTLPEGESDCWTFWRYGLPALGIPSATMTNKLQAEHVALFPDTLYLIQEPAEPGKQDAGKQYVEKMCKRLAALNYHGKVFIVSLKATHDVKDPNALLQKLYRERRVGDFKEEYQKALDAATPIDIYQTEQDKQADDVTVLVEEAIEQQDSTALYRLAKRIAELDTMQQGILKKTIQTGMKKSSGWSWSTFKELLQEGKRAAKKEQVYTTDKPHVLLGRQLREEVDDALDALCKANHPPVIYTRDGRLVRIRIIEKSKPSIETYEENAIIERLTRVAEFVTYNEQKGTYSSAHPTSRIARTILAQPAWTFPPLKGIVEMPVVRPNGSILDSPGYDEETQLYYVQHENMKSCKVPLQPTQEDIEHAKTLLENVIGEFPYESQADRTNALGFLLSFITRYMYEGDVQNALVNATKQGTGKTLLVHVACVIATGRTAPLRDFPQKEEEVKKVVDSKVLAGVNIIVFDNVKRKFESSAIDALTTSNGRYSLRPLGQSKDITLDDVRCMVVATGNNMQLDTDQARRCFQIRLTSPVSNPDERDDFTIKNLIPYTQMHRGELVAALLTLVRAWYVAGKPHATNKLAKSASTFAAWANTVGGVLEHAGICGFLDNRARLKAEANEEEAQTDAFLHAWMDWNDSLIPAKWLADEIVIGFKEETPAQTPAKKLSETLPDDLIFKLQDKPKTFTLALTKWLEKRVKTPYGTDNIRIERSKDKHSKSNVWQVVRVSEGVCSQPTREQNDFFSQKNEEKKEKKNHFEIENELDQTPANSDTRKEMSYEEGILV